MKRYFEFTGYDNYDFWEVEVIETSIIINEGKIGSEGVIKKIELETKQQVDERLNRIIEDQVFEGFTEKFTLEDLDKSYLNNIVEPIKNYIKSNLSNLLPDTLEEFKHVNYIEFEDRRDNLWRMYIQDGIDYNISLRENDESLERFHEMIYDFYITIFNENIEALGVSVSKK